MTAPGSAGDDGVPDPVVRHQRPAGQLSSAVSLFLAVFAVVTFYLAIASLRTDLVLTAILWLIFVGLVLLSIGAGASIGSVTKAAGWVVLAFALLARYHAAGDVIAAIFGRTILPVGPPLIRSRMPNAGGPSWCRPCSACHHVAPDRLMACRGRLARHRTQAGSGTKSSRRRGRHRLPR